MTWTNTGTLIFGPYFDVVKTQDLDFQLSDMMDPEDTMVIHIAQNSGMQISIYNSLIAHSLFTSLVIYDHNEMVLFF